MDQAILKKKLEDKIKNKEKHYSKKVFEEHNKLFHKKHESHREYEDLFICAEEMAELTQCISKIIRGKEEIKSLNMLEEINDVEFCLEQLKFSYLDKEDIEKIKYIKDIKHERFMERMKKGEF